MRKQIEMNQHRSFWNRSALFALLLAAPSKILVCFLILAGLLLAGATPLVYAQAGSIATVDSRAFVTDIAEYKSQVDQLNREFETRTREVQKLAYELRNYEIDLNTNRLNYTEPVRRERTEQLERMRKEYKRKSEDIEAD